MSGYLEVSDEEVRADPRATLEPYIRKCVAEKGKKS